MYGTNACGIGNQQMTTGMENSKEFVNFNFKVAFTGDEANPV